MPQPALEESLRYDEEETLEQRRRRLLREYDVKVLEEMKKMEEQHKRDAETFELRHGGKSRLHWNEHIKPRHEATLTFLFFLAIIG